MMKNATTLFLLLALGSGCRMPGDSLNPNMVLTASIPAADGVNIVHDVRGQGDTALVFVHCWSCNRDYWRHQAGHFLNDFRVVTLDLPGHGDSGMNRKPWTVLGYARDVKTVVEALDLERVILIGHSMGGPVSLEAARLMPDRVIGIVAVDTLHNAEFEFPKQMAETMIAGFEKDFEGTMTGAIKATFGAGAYSEAGQWVISQAIKANPEVAIALLKDFANLDMPKLFAGARVPIRAINANVVNGQGYKTEVEINRKYADFQVILMNDVGHFLQLEKPEEFNVHLKAVVSELADR